MRRILVANGDSLLESRRIKRSLHLIQAVKLNLKDARLSRCDVPDPQQRQILREAGLSWRGAEVQVSVRTSRLSCKRAEKARIYSCRLGIHLEAPGLIFGQLSSRMSGHEVVPYDA